MPEALEPTEAVPTEGSTSLDDERRQSDRDLEDRQRSAHRERQAAQRELEGSQRFAQLERQKAQRELEERQRAR